MQFQCSGSLRCNNLRNFRWNQTKRHGYIHIHDLGRSRLYNRGRQFSEFDRRQYSNLKRNRDSSRRIPIRSEPHSNRVSKHRAFSIPNSSTSGSRVRNDDGQFQRLRARRLHRHDYRNKQIPFAHDHDSCCCYTSRPARLRNLGRLQLHQY